LIVPLALRTLAAPLGPESELLMIPLVFMPLCGMKTRVLDAIKSHFFIAIIFSCIFNDVNTVWDHPERLQYDEGVKNSRVERLQFLLRENS